MKLNQQKGGKSRIVTLVRDKVRIEDQAAKLTVSKVEGEIVGVIKIPSFYIGLTDDVKKLLVDAEKKKIGALIVDPS